MTFDEQEKFKKDVKNWLAISDLTFFALSDPESRKQKFLSLLPRSTIQKYNLLAVFGLNSL